MFFCHTGPCMAAKTPTQSHRNLIKRGNGRVPCCFVSVAKQKESTQRKFNIQLLINLKKLQQHTTTHQLNPPPLQLRFVLCLHFIRGQFGHCVLKLSPFFLFSFFIQVLRFQTLFCFDMLAASSHIVYFTVRCQLIDYMGLLIQRKDHVPHVDVC